MKKISRAASSLVLALLVAGIAAVVVPAPSASAATTACTPQTNPFTVTSATWGTSAVPISAYPGSQNVPLTITMLFSGPCTSPQTSFTLVLYNTPSFTGPGGATQPKVVSLNISPNTFVTETFNLNIGQTATTGITYERPLTIQYANNTVSDVITEATAVGFELVRSDVVRGWGDVEVDIGLIVMRCREPTVTPWRRAWRTLRRTSGSAMLDRPVSV